MPAETLEKIVPLDLSYATLDDDGVPQEVTQRWYLYYTMGSISAMFKKLGVPEDEVQQITDALREQDIDDEEEADAYIDEHFGDMLATKVHKTEMEVAAIHVWSAMQWHARQKGVSLTVEDVAYMLDGANLERVMEQWQKAYSMFQSGDPEGTEEEDEDDLGKG